MNEDYFFETCDNSEKLINKAIQFKKVKENEGVTDGDTLFMSFNALNRLESIQDNEKAHTIKEIIKIFDATLSVVHLYDVLEGQNLTDAQWRQIWLAIGQREAGASGLRDQICKK